MRKVLPFLLMANVYFSGPDFCSATLEPQLTRESLSQLGIPSACRGPLQMLVSDSLFFPD